jgi:ribonuclease HI
VAATLDQLAKDRPHRAERLKALSDEARKRAAEEWQWIAEHAGSGLDERSDESGESGAKA